MVENRSAETHGDQPVIPHVHAWGMSRVQREHGKRQARRALEILRAARSGRLDDPQRAVS